MEELSIVKAKLESEKWMWYWFSAGELEDGEIGGTK